LTNREGTDGAGGKISASRQGPGKENRRRNLEGGRKKKRTLKGLANNSGTRRNPPHGEVSDKGDTDKARARNEARKGA